MKSASLASVVTYGAIFLVTIGVYAQQAGPANPADVKPAQAASPGAHPLGIPSTPNPVEQPRQRINQPGVQVTAGYSPTDERGENQEQNLDRVLAACLLTANKAEVELGKLATQRATDRDVKTFAQQMVKDHSKQVETLQEFIGGQEPNDRRSQIDQQIAERCTENLKKELDSKSGKDFDACYIGAQIGGHLHMVAALAVLSDQTTGRLHDIVKDAQPTVDKHLDQAKALMDQLDKSSDRRQASNKRNDTER
jgi:putative membrane protein